MLEIIENAFQIIVLIIFVILSFVYGSREKERKWTLLFFYYACFLLGNAYWQMCLFYYGKAPQIALVSDISWYAGLIFLTLLIYTEEIQKDWKSRLKNSSLKFLPYLSPVFTVAMAIYFMQYGKYVSNIIYAIIMGILMFFAIVGIIIPYKNEASFLCIAALCFCLFDYGTWIFSCFYENTPIYMGYYIFDILMSLVLPFFLIFIKRRDAYDIR